MIHFWAKTVDGLPGISVRDHCVHVGCVAQELGDMLGKRVCELLPAGFATLAAAHDVGKMTVGFQIKCAEWNRNGAPEFSDGEAVLSVSDHALVSQVDLQAMLPPAARTWAVAVGAHHGRPKGRNAPPGCS